MFFKILFYFYNWTPCFIYLPVYSISQNVAWFSYAALTGTFWKFQQRPRGKAAWGSLVRVSQLPLWVLLPSRKGSIGVLQGHLSLWVCVWKAVSQGRQPSQFALGGAPSPLISS